MGLRGSQMIVNPHYESGNRMLDFLNNLSNATGMNLLKQEQTSIVEATPTENLKTLLHTAKITGNLTQFNF